MEEVGTLGYIFACVFGVGAELVCDAIVLHGTDAQRERYVKPLLRGELFAAECLTEPRGGSDFFGTTTRAPRTRAITSSSTARSASSWAATAADYFLVYARTDPGAEAARGASPASSSTAGPGVETNYLYGLMGCRGGGAGRVVFQRRAGARRRTCSARLHGAADGLQHDDDPGAARHRGDDHRRGAPRARDRHALHARRRKAFGQHHPPSSRA